MQLYTQEHVHLCDVSYRYLYLNWFATSKMLTCNWLKAGKFMMDIGMSVPHPMMFASNDEHYHLFLMWCLNVTKIKRLNIRNVYLRLFWVVQPHVIRFCQTRHRKIVYVKMVVWLFYQHCVTTANIFVTSADISSKMKTVVKNAFESPMLINPFSEISLISFPVQSVQLVMLRFKWFQFH